MRSITSFIIVLFAGLALGKPSLNIRTVNLHPHSNATESMEVLRISNAYEEEGLGEWGDIDVCPYGSFASAFEIKYQAPDHLDETAVNGIKLYCSIPDAPSLIGYISSSVGFYGEWYGIKFCPSNFITGFRSNVLAYQGTFIDDVAVENIQIECGYGTDVLDPFQGMLTPRLRKFYYGEWSSMASCKKDFAVCGIATKVEGIQLGDEVAVADVILYCCERN